MATLNDADDIRWKAVIAKNKSADGQFFYSIRTTGVYCRPSCAARPARRENVAFHRSGDAAEAAGFRACKRCRPRQASQSERDAAMVARACDLMQKSATPPRLAALAAAFDLSPFHFHRVFKRAASLPRPMYSRLASIANRWNELLGVESRYPGEHAAFLSRCHAAGQIQPTALLLQYVSGDFNCLHQDVYGEHVFPLQAAILLSDPGQDFAGGDFVVTEQRPRRQSRVEVLQLRRGDLAIFAVRDRPARGARGIYRVKHRHGVSRIHSGRRHMLGLVFHDAN